MLVTATSATKFTPISYAPLYIKGSFEYLVHSTLKSFNQIHQLKKKKKLRKNQHSLHDNTLVCAASFVIRFFNCFTEFLPQKFHSIFSHEK